MSPYEPIELPLSAAETLNGHRSSEALRFGDRDNCAEAAQAKNDCCALQCLEA